MNNSGQEMHRLIERLYPICRSITGNGVRETLRILQEYIPLEIHEVPSGTKVFDWTVPKEWNIKDAYVKNSKGEKIIDFQKSNLHIVNYSIPVRKKVSLAELKEHIYTLPEHPEWIPYVTSYYSEEWGFCVAQKQYDQLPDDIYEVVVDSTLTDGHLTYGELHLPGVHKEEMLLTTYTCHPSMCNDNLSGIALLAFLAQHRMRLERKYSYRFLFIPETIGAITWLALNESATDRIRHGLVVSCVGDRGEFTYKKTRAGDALIDHIVEKVLTDLGVRFQILDFFPYLGSDERQFSSPGFALPIGSLMRTPHNRYPEYHTSADDLAMVNPESLRDSLEIYMQVLAILEHNTIYESCNPKCEPQLGRRGLYKLIGAKDMWGVTELAVLCTLNLSDGSHSLLDIARRTSLPFHEIKQAADALYEEGLLKKREAM